MTHPYAHYHNCSQFDSFITKKFQNFNDNSESFAFPENYTKSIESRPLNDSPLHVIPIKCHINFYSARINSIKLWCNLWPKIFVGWNSCWKIVFRKHVKCWMWWFWWLVSIMMWQSLNFRFWWIFCYGRFWE